MKMLRVTHRNEGGVLEMREVAAEPEEGAAAAFKAEVIGMLEELDHFLPGDVFEITEEES